VSVCVIVCILWQYFGLRACDYVFLSACMCMRSLCVVSLMLVFSRDHTCGYCVPVFLCLRIRMCMCK
jgi:hypothetical protein